MNIPPIFKTSRVLARPYSQTDYQAFISIMTDPELNYYMDNNVLSEDEADDLFEKIHQIYNSHPGKPFYIWALEHQGLCAGHLELKQTENTSANELEVVYMLDKSYWGKGLMMETLEGVLPFAKELGFSVIATVDKGNGRSIRLLKRIGISNYKELESDNRVWKIRLTEA